MRDSERLVEVASLLAVGKVPDEIVEALRLGRLTALSKRDGGVRGIVVGDGTHDREEDRVADCEASGSSHSSLPVRSLNEKQDASAMHTCCSP